MTRFHQLELLLKGILVGAVLSSSVVGQQKPKRHRGIDIGQTQHFTHCVGPLQRVAMESVLREFIWEHWSQKRRGRISARFYSIDSGPITQKIEIKLNKAGNWTVISTVEEKFSWISALLRPKLWLQAESTVETFDLLDRVEPATTPVPFVGELPDLAKINGDRIEVITTSESRSPETYRLSFHSTIKPAANWLF
jgi:hypothetical protein